ncbi:hypothetical protein H6F90_25695 [Trichocoleus sp. FACHB-591]|uniref:hypothetical protein n=1 Tax=unclassified Trichocoleus TaxID=2628910 RepID=UPI001685AE1D|nr:MULTISPECIES: hypothetical protein [unclassified Trichocoleus]MBD2098469.1 hypothetical protein [Trichocoleus sp. FACHB-591]MBD2123402.1 hypothetical protein [Trichocoleus sp. FACHB-262]
MNLKWFADRWYALLTTICSVILTTATLLAVYPFDFNRFGVLVLTAGLSWNFWYIGHSARSSEKKKKQLLQSYQKGSGEWITDPDLVKEVISAFKERSPKEVEDFYRDLQYKMHSLIKEYRLGNVRTGFVEVTEAYFQVVRPNVNPLLARQRALDELDSYK